MPRWAPFEPYFLGLVRKGAGDTCWLWTGGRDGKGYGRVWRDGRRQPAHRVAYEILVGQIPSGLQVCHHCDVKLCVRPSHLFIGTQVDNMQDWTKKGKNALINDPSKLARAAAHWAAKSDGRALISGQRKAEFRSGRRVVVRDARTGQLRGTKCSTARTS